MADNDKDNKKKVALDNLVNNEFFKQVIGSNEVKLRNKDDFFYGKIGSMTGETSYTNVMSSDGANKTRKEIYDERLKEREQLGIAEEAPYPVNYDLVKRVVSTIKESFARLFLEEAEDVVKKVGGKIDFEIPSQLKGITYEDIGKKIMSGQKPNSREQDAMAFYEIYEGLYNRALAKDLIDGNFFADLNNAGKKIAEKYVVKKKK